MKMRSGSLLISGWLSPGARSTSLQVAYGSIAANDKEIENDLQHAGTIAWLGRTLGRPD
jgi:hypothetical protein